MKTLQEIKEELLQDENFRREYEKKDPDFELAQQITRLRITQGLTQEDLARRIRTKQPSITRIESGEYTPTLKILRSIADALNVSLREPKFDTMSDLIIDRTQAKFGDGRFYQVSAKVERSDEDLVGKIKIENI